MASSRWHEVSLALLTAWRALPGYCTPAEEYTGLIPVYDGIDWQLVRTGGPRSYGVVRWPGAPEERRDAGRADQELRTIGSNRARDERGLIRCRIVAQTGDADITGNASAEWAAAFAMHADVENLLRTDPTLAVTAPRMLAQLSSLDARQYTERGTVTEIDFTVVYDTRI